MRDRLTEHLLPFALVPVTFIARNHSDRNYRSLEVEIYLTGEVEAYQDSTWTPSTFDLLGAPPRPWGPRKQPHLFAPPFITPSIAPSFPNVRGPTLINGGSVTIISDPVDLRPHKDEILCDNYVLVIWSEEPTEITGTWTATATDANGHISGELRIPISQVQTITEIVECLVSD